MNILRHPESPVADGGRKDLYAGLPLDYYAPPLPGRDVVVLRTPHNDAVMAF